MMIDQDHYLGDQIGAVAMEDSYQVDGFNYEGYDDGTGVIDPNTRLPYASAEGNRGI